MKLFRNIFLMVACVLLVACDSGKTEVADLSLPESAKESLHVREKASLASTHGVSYYYIKGLKDISSTDTIIAHLPLTNNETMECLDSTCTTYFEFSSKKYPAFNHQQALGGVLGNAGDLDSDGVCEIYFVPDWFTSNWTGLNIYSLKNNKWEKIASGSVRRDEGGDTDSHAAVYEQRIKKHNKEYFEIMENVMDDNGDQKLVAKKFYFKK